MGNYVILFLGDYMKKFLLVLLFLFPFIIFADEKAEDKEINKEIFMKIGSNIRMDLPSDVLKTSVIWQSNNTSVATVDEDGVVLGNAPGEAVITATTTEGFNLEYNITVVSTVKYYWTKTIEFVKKNLIAFEILAVLGLIFVFIKLAY